MDKFESKKLVIIGGGHLGQALVQGLVNSGKISGYQMVVANPSLSKISYLADQGVRITTDNRAAAKDADWIFLAIKPFIVEKVLSEISDLIIGKVVVSLAAVVSIKKMTKWAKNASIIRVMPNVAISVNQGTIGMYSRNVSGGNKKLVKSLLSLLGLVVEVNREDDLNTVTLLSGCGPAIVSQFIEILAEYGSQNGLTLKKSRTMTMQTFKGTLSIVDELGDGDSGLINSVATRGGITEIILKDLKRNGFQDRFIRAMDSGYTRIRELQKNLYD